MSDEMRGDSMMRYEVCNEIRMYVCGNKASQRVHLLVCKRACMWRTLIIVMHFKAAA